MKSLIISTFLSLFVLGCQSQTQSRKYWYNPDATLEQAIEDFTKCKESARGDAQAGHYDRYRDRSENIHSAPYNSELDRVDRDSDYLYSFRSRMRSLGYQPVPEHRLKADIRKIYRFGDSEIQYIAGK